VRAVAERVDERLAASQWDLASVAVEPGEVSAAAEVAVFALKLAGKRHQARRGGRFGRLIVRFALAACVALASAAAACAKPDANPEATAVAISELPSATAFTASITAQPRASPAQFTDLLLLDAGSSAQPWAVLVSSGGNVPVLVDRTGSGLDKVGDVYRLAGQPVPVGTRDGQSQFLDPLQSAVSTGSDLQAATSARGDLLQRWSQDERFLAATRAIAGQPTVLDAAYNAAAAAAAGGTHTYLNGVVLRVEPDNPVVQVIDRALLESGRPTRAEDVVYVAIRAGERSLYEPGQVVNLRDVVMDTRNTDVNGEPTTVYVANAALDGARVEPTGRVDLQSLLQPRLERVDQDLAVQAQEVGGAGATAPAAVQPTATPGGTTPIQPPVVVNRYSGPSFVDDFLIFMWLSNSGFYRGSTVIINNPPSSAGRPGGGVYYSSPPAPAGSSPSTIASSQAASRSTALEAARTSISGQSSGTGGGVAATNKSATDASARVSAATAKSASVAGEVSSSSAGRSVSSVASASSASSSTASRSAGTTSAGSRGSAGSSSSGSSSGGKGISGSSGGSSGFGGKGVGGGGGSSS
jgi:hypothetical protein